jgi:hypothetical protein
MAPLDQVAVPSQHGVRLDQQSQSAQDLPRQRRQQSGEESAVLRAELHLVRTELPLENHDLVAQNENLRILVPVAHRQQPHGSESVGDSQVRETK